ncbi:2,3,4,5-tetrahydropyridine-2,6-dicarboxylate N-succinyltransferase [Algoriphagus boritolerans]|uniref:2,3,4,5-tetrahydropyridine-2,6-dicarboxylate N-succinyltransferase n=1 Tax=Algoriphagus boritolerans TaxID=308111 RepID=UPI000ACA1C01
MELKTIIEAAWENRELLKEKETEIAIKTIIADLDTGQLRVAEPTADGNWKVNDWVKKAVILYFPIQKMQTIEVGPFEFHDKMALKTNYAKQGVRVVPHAVARYGAYLASGVVMMPSYVNIGAYVDSGTMVDTWATVGSCAQIGKKCSFEWWSGYWRSFGACSGCPGDHRRGCIYRFESIIVEGVRIGKEAVIGAGVTLTASSKIIDVTGSEPVEYKGYVPPRSVVIPGSLAKNFPAGTYQVPCALIIGQRKASTDLKTSLNDALRENNVAV